jgi:hypothetical protein
MLAGTSLRGDTMVGRSEPVQLKGGSAKLRPLPRCTTYAQACGPALCACLCSGQALCRA